MKARSGIVAALSLVLVLLGGCGTGLFKPEEVKVGVPAKCLQPDGKTNQTCAIAFQIITEGNIALASVDRTVEQRRTAKIWTKAQADPILAMTEEYGEKLSQAMTIWRNGDFVAALTSANVQKRLIEELQRQVAKAAAGPPQ